MLGTRCFLFSGHVTNGAFLPQNKLLQPGVRFLISLRVQVAPRRSSIIILRKGATRSRILFMRDARFRFRFRFRLRSMVECAVAPDGPRSVDNVIGPRTCYDLSGRRNSSG